jgi:hypothetical protein
MAHARAPPMKQALHMSRCLKVDAYASAAAQDGVAQPNRLLEDRAQDHEGASHEGTDNGFKAGEAA